VIGSSFGGAVAVYAGGTNPRIAAVISNGGWGHGERKFRGQHPTPEAWAKFTAMLEEGRAHRARTGKSLMVPRDDIVPIPAHVRENLDKQNVEMLAPNSVEMFPAETAQSMFDFRAEEVVGKIAPRPLLLIHAANDSVTPTEQSIEMFKRAGQPTELHLFSGLDHFLFNENSTRVWNVLRNWLDAYFPAKVRMSQGVSRERHRGRSRRARALHPRCARPSRKGASAADAAIVAEGLVWANLRGVDGHGVSRLPSYLKMIERGEIDPKAQPR
jgi:hypothetical protein